MWCYVACIVYIVYHNPKAYAQETCAKRGESVPTVDCRNYALEKDHKTKLLTGLILKEWSGSLEGETNGTKGLRKVVMLIEIQA